MSRLTAVTVSFFMAFASGGYVSADTIIMKDNQQIKGVVVEEYRDRVVISTMEGEKEIMKSGINNVVYDMEEQNLSNLGDFYQDRGMYRKAYFYYDKALKLNPNYKRAKDGINYVGTYLQQTDRMRKLDHIKRMNQEKDWKGKPGVTTEAQNEDAAIKEDLGISLDMVDNDFKVTEVSYGSPADKAGIKEDDIILAAWGRAIGYMDTNEVKNRFANTGVMDVQLTILRAYALDLNGAKKLNGNLLGVRLGFSEMEGLMVEQAPKDSVASRFGVREDDIITSIDGQSTRYMSLKEVVDLINSRDGGKISFKVKRDVVIWKKFNA